MYGLCLALSRGRQAGLQYLLSTPLGYPTADRKAGDYKDSLFGTNVFGDQPATGFYRNRFSDDVSWGDLFFYEARNAPRLKQDLEFDKTKDIICSCHRPQAQALRRRR